MKFIFEAFLLFMVVTHQSNFALIQGFAWISMLSEYSLEETSFSDAVRQTFNGKDPCELCKIIQSEQKDSKEKSSSTENKEKKKERKTETIVDIRTFHSNEAMRQVVMLKEFNHIRVFLTQNYPEVPFPPPRTLTLS